MTKLLPKGLSGRERQIMQILYDKGQATVAEVLAALPDPPGYSAVRCLIAILEEKGQVNHFGERFHRHLVMMDGGIGNLRLPMHAKLSRELWD